MTQNIERNAQFRLFLLALPIATSIPYLIALASRQTFFLAILALTSLGSTAYLLYHQEPGTTGIDILDGWSRPRSPRHSPAGASSSSSSSARRGSNAFSFPEHKSPLELYLPYLNLGLAVILIMMGLFTRVDDGRRLSRIGLGNLPALVYAVVLVAKIVMGSVDPEKELGALKYEYKGA
jgi:hypothetical protein